METWSDLVSVILQWNTTKFSGKVSETESILITQNNIKARIDKTQQNSRFRLCGERDEAINHIISECSTLAQKEYKTRYELVGTVIHWKLCKKLKFDHTNKWYMHNPESVLEN